MANYVKSNYFDDNDIISDVTASNIALYIHV